MCADVDEEDPKTHDGSEDQRHTRRRPGRIRSRKVVLTLFPTATARFVLPPAATPQNLGGYPLAFVEDIGIGAKSFYGVPKVVCHFVIIVTLVGDFVRDFSGVNSRVRDRGPVLTTMFTVLIWQHGEQLQGYVDRKLRKLQLAALRVLTALAEASVAIARELLHRSATMDGLKQLITGCERTHGQAANDEASGAKQRERALAALAELALSDGGAVFSSIQQLDRAFEAVLIDREESKKKYGTSLGRMHEMMLIVLIRATNYGLSTSQLLEFVGGDVALALAIVQSILKVPAYEDELFAAVVQLLHGFLLPQTYAPAGGSALELQIEDFSSHVVAFSGGTFESGLRWGHAPSGSGTRQHWRL